MKFLIDNERCKQQRAGDFPISIVDTFEPDKQKSAVEIFLKLIKVEERNLLFRMRKEKRLKKDDRQIEDGMSAARSALVRQWDAFAYYRCLSSRLHISEHRDVHLPSHSSALSALISLLNGQLHSLLFKVLRSFTILSLR